MSAASHVLLQVRSGWWKHGTVRHATFMFVGNVSFNAASFLMFVILGRIVTVRDYGEVLSLLSIVMILSVPAGLLQPVITRAAAELIASGNRSAVSRVARSLTWPFVLLAVLIIAISTISRYPVAAYFHIERPSTIVWSGILLATSVLSPIQRAILQGAQQFGEYSLSQIIEATVKLIAVPVFAAAGLGVAGVLAGYIISLATAVAFNASVVRTRFGSARQNVVIPWRQLLRGARRTALAALTLTVLPLYDVIIVKHAFDPQNAGVYSAAAVVGRALLALVAFIPALIVPKVAVALARHEPTAQYLRGGLLATLGPIILALTLVVTAPGLVLGTMAGPAFSVGARLVLPLSLSGALLAIAGTISAYLTARKSFKFVVPLCTFAFLEIVTVAAWHPSLLTVARTVAIGHGVLLLSIALAAVQGTKKRIIGIVPRQVRA